MVGANVHRFGLLAATPFKTGNIRYVRPVRQVSKGSRRSAKLRKQEYARWVAAVNWRFISWLVTVFSFELTCELVGVVACLYLDKESAAKGRGRVVQEFALVSNQKPMASTPFSGMSINITKPSVFMVRTGQSM
jgi:hypothetical protein